MASFWSRSLRQGPFLSASQLPVSSNEWSKSTGTLSLADPLMSGPNSRPDDWMLIKKVSKMLRQNFLPLSTEDTGRVQIRSPAAGNRIAHMMKSWPKDGVSTWPHRRRRSTVFFWALLSVFRTTPKLGQSDEETWILNDGNFQHDFDFRLRLELSFSFFRFCFVFRFHFLRGM